MANQDGRQVINIENELYENAQDFDFFQALRLLSRLQVQEGTASDTNDALKNLRIHPELNLDYPDAPISSIEDLGDGKSEIITTFLGLYGISSPLPTFYTEALLDDEWDEKTASKDFFDVLHHHLYPLLFEAWQKYRFSHQAVEQNKSKYWDILFSLIGLSDKAFRRLTPYPERFLPYLGLLAQRQKSALGLETILKDLLGTDEVRIESCAFRYVAIPKEQYCRLGEANLGNDSVIGDLIEDRMGRALIHLGGITQGQFLQFLNDKDFIDFIWLLMDFYLLEPIEIRIMLHLMPGEIETAELGAIHWNSLGQDTWLDGEKDHVTEVVISRDEFVR